MSEEPKYVVGGTKPVNRRTASKLAAQAPVAVAPVARERVLAAHARSRLGAPVADQLRAIAARPRGRLAKQAVLGGMAAACGGLGLFLAWLHASAPGGMAAAAVAATGSLLAWRAPRAVGELSQFQAPVLLDPASVEAFDRALAALSAEVPPQVLQPLAEFKAVVVRIARHPAAGAVDEHFLLEDRLYVNECVRRYLPDSLQSYLAVPKEQRGKPLAEGQSAEALLLSQLAMLHGELLAREEKLARSAAEGLLRQDRFLRAKAGR
jgi:hypothetical protein